MAGGMVVLAASALFLWNDRLERTRRMLAARYAGPAHKLNHRSSILAMSIVRETGGIGCPAFVVAGFGLNIAGRA
jgi:hypothetical protein